MKKCINCKTSLDDDFKYCTYCGCKQINNSHYIIENIMIFFMIILIILLIVLFVISYIMIK